MYDHLQPRLAKYLAAIYTGTDVPEIERQDVRISLDEFAKVWRSCTKFLHWNMQRGQKINQLNRIICNQRLKMRELNRQLEFEKWMVDNRSLWLEACRRDFAKVVKWNNAHKREIAQLQSKLHDRRVEVKLLLNENDVFSRAIQRRNKKIRELQDEIVAERRKVDALNKCADTYDEINEDLIRAVMQQDVELADWHEYVQLLIAELNEKDAKSFLKLNARKKGMACMNNLTIKTVIDDHGSVPAYSRDDDAAVDLRASESCYIKAGAVRLVDTGVRVAIPSGYVGLVCPRSGMACKHEVTVINAPGVIDPNYRGSIKVGLVNHNSVGFDIREGDRIAQLLIVPVPSVMFQQVAELDDTERGADGFGSSGR